MARIPASSAQLMVTSKRLPATLEGCSSAGTIHTDQAQRCSVVLSIVEADAPGYRGVVTIWFDDMDLEPTHTLLPQMKVEVVTTADVYTYECKLAGLTDSDLSFNTTLPAGGSNATARNIFVLGPTPPKQTFEMLNVVNPLQHHRSRRRA